jgi:AraC-like DNA-binding protein/ligand-binding sensor protein
LESKLQSVFERVADGKLFAQYRDAFLAATGLPLMIVSWDEENWVPCTGGANETPFCKELNAKNHVCQACVHAANQLRSTLPCAAPSSSVTCFAGFQETAVPIRLGSDNFAFLKTGEVFNKEPTETNFEKVIETLIPLGYSEQQLTKLRDTYFDSPVIAGPRYEGVVALLATFSEHLERHVEELLLIEDHSEPESVTRAKEFIRGKLDEPIHLPEVATHAGVSQHHFSRIFKSSTGMSFTEYVARCRIELAKGELLKPYARVTEVAFEVGFQSLSQFNRSFSRVVGETPTQFRQRKLDSRRRAK